MQRTVYILAINIFILRDLANIAQKYNFAAIQMTCLNTALGNSKAALKNCTADAVITDIEIGSRTAEEFIWHAANGLKLPTICMYNHQKSIAGLVNTDRTYFAKKPIIARSIFPKLHGLLTKEANRPCRQVSIQMENTCEYNPHTHRRR